MSSAHVNSIAKHISADAVTFASLPLSLAHHIFLALLVDERARACCVCRAWRDVLAEPALWTRLDMSSVCADEGAEGRPRFLTVLRGAARRARGQLSHLQLSLEDLRSGEVLPLLTSNAGGLRELHLGFVEADEDGMAMFPTVDAVMAAAPLLQVLAAENVYCLWPGAPRVLRGEPPFARLQLRCNLDVRFDDDDGGVSSTERFGPFVAALADATLQPALSELCIQYADTAQPAVMGALVDAALARRLRKLSLHGCTPPAASPLARLLAGGSLTVLEIETGVVANDATPAFDAAGAALVADALRVNTTLTALELSGPDVFGDTHAAEVLLVALVGHRSLRELQLVEDHTVAENLGAALAALIAADAPALHVLTCRGNTLTDVGLTPIVAALALNHHVRELDLSWNDMSEEFAREQLLPAVRANLSLRELVCDEDEPEPPSAAEAVELVRRRELHD